MTHSYFDPANTTVADALETGYCTHIPDAMVYQVLTDMQRNGSNNQVDSDQLKAKA